MKVAIIGGGITGLAAAYHLSLKKHQVFVFEKEKFLGGLTAGLKQKNWSWSTERFFHHLFVSDQAARQLSKELNLKSQLFYQRPKTSIFLKNKTVQFDSASSVLRFPYLSFPEKSRTGLATFFLKTVPFSPSFDQKTAGQWLKKAYGAKAYFLLWQPLLQAKFHDQAEKISLAWFWGRLKKRSPQLGYFKGGFPVLVNCLAHQIKTNHGQIMTNQEIKKLQPLLSQYDRIIVTTPTASFLKMAPELPTDYQKQLKKLKMLGAVNLLLVLKNKFLTDNTYWLNINQKGFPFVAVVEHTNFVDPKHYANNHLLYVGGYYPQNHRYFKMKADQLWAEWQPHLAKINPQINIRRYYYHANLHAQPLVTTGYQNLRPNCRTPLKKVFLANMQMVYPYDRGINYAIALGKKVAHEAIKK